MELSRRRNDPDILKQVAWLVFWIGLCFATAFIGGLFTDTGSGSWYNQLDKPSWNPPRWVFGPVWTTLYTLMGIAAWLVWKEAGSFARAKTPLILFVVQLTLNMFWSIIFFGLENPGLALIEIGVLWVAIAATIAAFNPFSRTASVLLVPYLAWVTFAAALNFAVWWMN